MLGKSLQIDPMDEQRAANVYSLKVWVASMRTAAVIDRPSRAKDPVVLLEEGRLISAEGMLELAMNKLQAGVPRPPIFFNVFSHPLQGAELLQHSPTLLAGRCNHCCKNFRAPAVDHCKGL